MTIDRPLPGQISELRRLWQQAFGDTEAFLDTFFAYGFSPDRCRCVTLDGQTAAALYWFDAWLDGKKLAYLYAIATDASHRGKGLCRALMADTHRHLETLGYAGALLVPAERSLFDFYGRMGYRNFGCIREFSCEAGETPEPLRTLSPEEYARLRRSLLPPGGILQEGETLAFLSTQAAFYAGDGLLLAANTDPDTAFIPELLGDPARAPGILKALGKKTGIIRTPGEERPFAMYRSLTDRPPQTGYFGLALD